LDSPAVNGLITFLYYDDLEKAEEFYRDVMGFDLVVDQGWAKILNVAEKAHVGLVDGNVGYHKASPAVAQFNCIGNVDYAVYCGKTGIAYIIDYSIWTDAQGVSNRRGRGRLKIFTAHTSVNKDADILGTNI